MRRLLLVALTIAFLTSCNNPLNRYYSHDTFEEDMQALERTGELDSTTYSYIILSIQYSAYEGRSLNGKTYRQMINEGREIHEKNVESDRVWAKKVAEYEKERQKRVERLNKYLSVELKDISQDDFYEQLTYKLLFRNKKEKDIKAFNGRVHIYDKSGAHLKTLDLNYVEGIKSGESIPFNFEEDYYQDEGADVALMENKMNGLKVTWLTDKILFVDGTELVYE